MTELGKKDQDKMEEESLRIVRKMFVKILKMAGVEVTVKGYEPTSVFKFFVDGKLIYKCNVNFTSSPVALSNVTTYEYNDTTTTISNKIVPNVYGLPYNEAVNRLNEEGFKNINPVGDTENGVVIKMEPTYGVSVALDKEITLTFGDNSGN